MRTTPTLSGTFHTQQSRCFFLATSIELSPSVQLIPASVWIHNCNNRLVDTGPAVWVEEDKDPPTTENFWSFILQQGGEWVWGYMEGAPTEITWLALTCHDRTTILVTDGSFNHTLVAPLISGARCLSYAQNNGVEGNRGPTTLLSGSPTICEYRFF